MAFTIIATAAKPLGLGLPKQSEKLKDANLAKTNHYRTFAARPEYSVLDNTKAQNTLKVKYIDWQESLQSVLKNTGINL